MSEDDQAAAAEALRPIRGWERMEVQGKTLQEVVLMAGAVSAPPSAEFSVTRGYDGFAAVLEWPVQ